jgi:hypothetical protein
MASVDADARSIGGGSHEEPGDAGGEREEKDSEPNVAFQRLAKMVRGCIAKAETIALASSQGLARGGGSKCGDIYFWWVSLWQWSAS